MRIGGGCYQLQSYNRTNAKLKTFPVQNSRAAAQAQTLEKRGEKTFASVWDELSQKYDVRNATFEELCDISMELYQAGEISLRNHAIMTFDPSKSPQPIKANLFLTPSDAEGRRDWIKEYQARYKHELELNNLQGAEEYKKIIKILKRLV